MIGYVNKVCVRGRIQGYKRILGRSRKHSCSSGDGSRLSSLDGIDAKGKIVS